MSLFTGDVEADQKLLLRMDARTVLNACIVNKTVGSEVCTSEFFEKWLRQHYTGTVAFKPSYQSWRNYAIEVIHFDAKLQEEFGVKATIGNPKEEYEEMTNARRSPSKEEKREAASKLLKDRDVLINVVLKFRDFFTDIILDEPKLYSYVYKKNLSQ